MKLDGIVNTLRASPHARSASTGRHCRGVAVAPLFFLFCSTLGVGGLSPAHGQDRFEGEGVVVAIDSRQGTITLDHGPIPGFMAAMRMTFAIRHNELLRDLSLGDVVRFALVSRGTEWVIDHVEPAGSPGRSAIPTIMSPDFTLPALAGNPIRLSDLRGKVVLLNFWATWCVPCRTEMPAIEALYQRYQEQGLEVVGVNMDKLSVTTVETFIRDVRTTFPIGLDPSWTVAEMYKVVGLPTTFLLDRTGHIVVREVGGRNWGDEMSHAAVMRLLVERRPISKEDQR
jgi:peroxiredoxin/Cu/Ag efflux protein CusF